MEGGASLSHVCRSRTSQSCSTGRRCNEDLLHALSFLAPGAHADLRLKAWQAATRHTFSSCAHLHHWDVCMAAGLPAAAATRNLEYTVMLRIMCAPLPLCAVRCGRASFKFLAPWHPHKGSHSALCSRTSKGRLQMRHVQALRQRMVHAPSCAEHHACIPPSRPTLPCALLQVNPAPAVPAGAAADANGAAAGGREGGNPAPRGGHAQLRPEQGNGGPWGFGFRVQLVSAH